MDGFISGISSIEKISEIVSEGKEFDSIKPEDYALFSKNKESWKESFGKKIEQEIPGADILKKMKDIDKNFQIQMMNIKTVLLMMVNGPENVVILNGVRMVIMFRKNKIRKERRGKKYLTILG